MCRQCKKTPKFPRRRVPKGRNSFSYFFRRSIREDEDRKSYYISLLDEIHGSDDELAIRLSSKIADIQEDFRERLPEWLQDPLERLKLREAFCYFHAESGVGARSRFVLEKLTASLPHYIFDDLVHCTHDAKDDACRTQPKRHAIHFHRPQNIGLTRL